MKSLIELLFLPVLLIVVPPASCQEIADWKPQQKKLMSPWGEKPNPGYLFESGTDGYHTFRIPAIVTTKKGTLLAFAEGRRNSTSDTGDIDLVLKRSEDDGKTWSDLTVIRSDRGNVCGNPAPVVDHTTGKIFLLSTWNLGTDHEPDIIDNTSEDTRRVFVLSSSDDGKTWSKPKEITGAVKKSDWTWYATGPCHGIQVENGRYRGRMVIPCDHIELGTKKYFSHIIYSDNHGKSWKLGGSTLQDQVNECTVVELTNGRLMLNMRNYDRAEKSRKVSLSNDGGETWSSIFSDKTLIEPICQASLLRYSSDGTIKLLFLNPAHEVERKNMTIRVSEDDGSTWSGKKVLFAGPSAYSDMTVLPNGNIGCLYEAGLEHPYQGIVFQEVRMDQLE
ncbi:MAG: exo-alpha-sialidase [Bacteroidales bacterium]|nr:exo-alpha-sialidase [Bacteroidales bacterium]